MRSTETRLKMLTARHQQARVLLRHPARVVRERFASGNVVEMQVGLMVLHTVAVPPDVLRGEVHVTRRVGDGAVRRRSPGSCRGIRSSRIGRPRPSLLLIVRQGLAVRAAPDESALPIALTMLVALGATCMSPRWLMLSAVVILGKLRDVRDVLLRGNARKPQATP